MASLRTTYHSLSTRLLCQRVRAADLTVRAISTSPRCRAAQNFKMPALSPTMTEGNITTWRVHDGDKFQAGDVLLEIETDKATMDVEAQEDGVMVKVMQPDGSKSVQVGTRIAVIADSGDDIAALEMPPDPSKTTNEAAPRPAADGSVGNGGSGGRGNGGEGCAKQQQQQPSGQSGPAKKHGRKYPLLPSVAQLVKQHAINEADADAIVPTGPAGRLLKGDVLAYLGRIDPNAPASISAMFDRASRLDLTNIKVAKREQQQKDTTATGPAKKEAESPAAKPPPPAVIEKTVSLHNLAMLQAKISRALGVHVPMELFFDRAADAANDDLPARARLPSADDIFDDILGIARPGGGASRRVRGSFKPAPKPAKLATPPPPLGGEPDIIDVLAGTKPTLRGLTIPADLSSSSTGECRFVLSVSPEDRIPAVAFMDKFSHLLAEEPQGLAQGMILNGASRVPSSPGAVVGRP